MDLLEQLTQLGADVEQLRNGDDWKRYLQVAGKFHQYSIGNQILIWMQNPDATRVAGYKTWQQLKRQVRKGERGLKILAPMPFTKMETSAQGTQEERAGIRFKVVSVFDVSQTDGDQLPDIPDWPLAGGNPSVQYDTLVDVLRTRSVKVVDVGAEHPIVKGGARGWCIPATGEVYIALTIPPAARVAVLLHELGHLFDPDVSIDMSRADKELVAESTAWLVGSRIGLEMDDQVVHYLASWGGEAKELLAVAGRIDKSVSSILSILVDVPDELAA